MSARHPVRHHTDGARLYAAVPTGLARDGELSHAARSVALYVWSHDDKWRQSVGDVADKMGMGRSTVIRALAELQDRRWFIRERVSQHAEVWHLQMANRRFTPDEMTGLSGKPLLEWEGSTQTDTPPELGGVTDDPSWDERDTPPGMGGVTPPGLGPHRSRTGVHLEVHDCSSAGRDGEDDPQRESEPDVYESVSSTPDIFDASPIAQHLDPATDPFASQPSDAPDPFASAPIGTSAQEDEPPSSDDWGNPLGLDSAIPAPATTLPDVDVFDPFAS